MKDLPKLLRNETDKFIMNEYTHTQMKERIGKRAEKNSIKKRNANLIKNMKTNRKA